MAAHERFAALDGPSARLRASGRGCRRGALRAAWRRASAAHAVAGRKMHRPVSAAAQGGFRRERCVTEIDPKRDLHPATALIYAPSGRPPEAAMYWCAPLAPPCGAVAAHPGSRARGLSGVCSRSPAVRGCRSTPRFAGARPGWGVLPWPRCAGLLRHTPVRGRAAWVGCDGNRPETRAGPSHSSHLHPFRMPAGGGHVLVCSITLDYARPPHSGPTGAHHAPNVSPRAGVRAPTPAPLTPPARPAPTARRRAQARSRAPRRASPPRARHRRCRAAR